MKARPQTSELTQCQLIVLGILQEIEAILPVYADHHRGSSQHHDVAEAQLFCRNLRHQLELWADPAGHANALTRLFDTAEQGDRLVAVFERHHGDARLDHALARLAECLRLMGPAVLRWQHGGRSGRAHEFLATREQRVHHDLVSLKKSLMLA
jgi:hypothetical protein